MSDLERLGRRLEAAMNPSSTRALERCAELDRCIALMEKRLRADALFEVPPDLTEQALQRFWSSKQFERQRDMRLVCFGVATPFGPQRLRIVEHRPHFDALLKTVAAYDATPKRLRRCFQGLLFGYFHYDPNEHKEAAVGKENWERLRHFLSIRTNKLVDTHIVPAWVEQLQGLPALLSTDPCRPLVAPMLDGNHATIAEMCICLGIQESSWFTRALILATVKAATQESDSAFVDRLTFLLDLLARHSSAHDAGLAMMLDRYVSAQPATPSKLLKDAAVESWGNPWLKRNLVRWHAVSPQARDMVSDWLKLEFVEAFFSVLADEQTGDRRRLAFWRRYIRSIEDVTFALGRDARESRSADLVALRKKTEGLHVALRDQARGNNAFIMRLGRVTAVEFAAAGNACYFYEGDLPFDVTNPVVTRVDEPNSLKHSSRKRKLKHDDRGGRWEDNFETYLREAFRLEPDLHAVGATATTAGPRTSPSPWPDRPNVTNAVAPSNGSSQFAEWPRTSYSQRMLAVFAERFHLRVEDLSQQNGNLWVRTGDTRSEINSVLMAWGFTYRSPKGWWK